MNWSAFDLNLLLTFAVMQEKNITRTGRRPGMSQPAVTHALARLRHTLRDELFCAYAGAYVSALVGSESLRQYVPHYRSSR
jgi:Bacterial regulatory helix-turn-helix protein, lysR family